MCNDDFVRNIEKDGSIGYAFEVDIRIPTHLHDFLSDLPPLPERLEIRSEMLSNFQQEFFPESELQPQTRLTCNLYDKQNYCLHYKTLQFCLQLGLEVVNWKRVVKFQQKPFMRDYIDFNTAKRMEAAKEDNKFKVSLYKALNNFLFGRSIMNQRKFRDLRLVTTREHALRLISNPLFKHGTIIKDGLMIIEMSYATVKLDKPIYV